MNDAIREMWKAALTSGDYGQGIGALRNDKGQYCCLGVLTELYRKETGNGEWSDQGTYDSFVDEERCSAFLPESVRKWAGLSSTAPLTADGAFLDKLNDTGTSFAEIADLLDEL